MSDHSLWGWTSLLSVYLAALIWPINQAVLAIADARLSLLIKHLALIVGLSGAFLYAVQWYTTVPKPPQLYEYCPHPQTGEYGPVPACQKYHL